MSEMDNRRAMIIKLIRMVHEDSTLLEKFREAPDQIMNDNGIINQGERNILKSGDIKRIRELINDDVV
jgi:mevalonate kinase